MRSNMSSGDEAGLYLVTNEVAVQFNMLCPFVKDWIGSNVKSSLIITVKLSSLRMRKTEVLKEISQPS